MPVNTGVRAACLEDIQRLDSKARLCLTAPLLLMREVVSETEQDRMALSQQVLVAMQAGKRQVPAILAHIRAQGVAVVAQRPSGAKAAQLQQERSSTAERAGPSAVDSFTAAVSAFFRR